MSKFIEVTLVIEIPDFVEDEDIKDYLDVEFAHVNGMRFDNPLIDNCEVVEHYWRHER